MRTAARSMLPVEMCGTFRREETPSACVPVTVAPWAPGAPTVQVCGKPLLNNTSKLMCSYGGVIQVTVTPAVTVQTP